MSQRNAVVLGGSGGIGKLVVSKLLSNCYPTIAPWRSELDLTSDEADKKIVSLLTGFNPGIVVNSAGVYRPGFNDTHAESFNVNVGSNWSILRYYMERPDQVVTIVIVGSSSYNGARPQHPLYSASKSAVFNMWESAAEYFKNTNVSVHLINPVRTKTKMVEEYHKPGMDYLDPSDVADKILELSQERGFRCVDMNFKETK